MLGAIAGDIIGSPHEFESMKSTDFPLYVAASRFTDDTVLTAATAFSLMTDGDYAANYRLFGRLYPLAGYGSRFDQWLKGEDTTPYGSYGNGSAMRVSPVGFALDDENEVLAEAERSAAVTHDHPEGIKGAQAVALAVFLARRGADAETLRGELTSRFGYDLARTPEGIRPGYVFDETCQGSVPEALICALVGDDWERCVRLAVSLGGDADTLACMAGAVAQARFGGVPKEVDTQAQALLPAHLLDIVKDFEARYGGDHAC
ncbi:MAG: ADP-ribosylglycohydrolase family protein [bacterium]|nr:ADP-ribosylglycohydrolase family protein [bacterium]